ncbi:MAG TPA: RNA methyltransferase [Saprospirales bacterium]|nr:RNA methyltransferase [Saprospirales bacterium]
MEKSTMENLGRLSVSDFKSREKYTLTLVLDEVRSGLNVGSIFRTADAFALEQVILCGITAQPPHREILKTALGSTESVSWQYFDETVQAVQWLKQEGYKVLAVEQTTPKLWLQDFQPLPDQRYAFIMGNEVEGVSETVLPLCDGALEIPQFGTKHSLNVAVAAGIVAWEFVRKFSEG